ncbi:MAG: hypothetical protein IJO10_04105 [Clostridia bacterium]|nr:hypothetical protein [Clostridia bacterium]
MRFFRAPGLMYRSPGYLSLIENGAKVEHLGMLHSHPSRANGEDNDEFSLGDAIVSVVSRRIYLTTPEGYVYALDRKDGWKLIVPGYKRERVNAADWQLYYGSVTEEELPKWIVEALAEDYVAKQDAKSKGSNFVTFDINTYNTRK